MKAVYQFQLLKADAAPDGPLRHLTYRELRVYVAVACPRYSLSMLNHMLAIAHSSPGHPVELILWNLDMTALEFQSRLTYQCPDTVLTAI